MRKLIYLIIFPILFLILTSCTGNVESDINDKNLALIAKMNTGNHWGFIKLGANAAAREFDVNVSVYAPWDEDDADEQIELVEQCLKDKIDALILAASDYDKLVDVTEKAYDKNIPVIIIDSEVNTDKIDSYIATDNVNAGKQAGTVLVNMAGKECNVALIGLVKGSQNTLEREKGLLDVISKYPQINIVDRRYCLSSIKAASEITKDIISKNDNIDVIVGLNEVSSEGAAQAIDELGLGGKVKIIASGNTLKEIDYLEDDIIQAIVLEKPFNMGYLGVKYAVDAMQGKDIPQRVDTDCKLIIKDNMYLPENQKLLFPLTS